MVKCTPEQALEIVALDTALERLAMLKIHVERRGGGVPEVLRVWAVTETGLASSSPPPVSLQRKEADALLVTLEALLRKHLAGLGAGR